MPKRKRQTANLPPAKKPKPQPPDRIESTSVTITVAKKKRYVITKAALIKSSYFFEAAVKYNWGLAGVRAIRLPEFCSDTFDVYRHWIRIGQLRPEIVDSWPGVNYDKNHAQIRYSFLLDLYELGDFVQDLAFCNAVTDAWAFESMGHKQVPSISTFNKATMSLPCCGLRRLIALQWWHLRPDKVEETFRKASEELSKDVRDDMIGMVCEMAKTGRSISLVQRYHPCDFHRHDEAKAPRCSPLPRPLFLFKSRTS